MSYGQHAYQAALNGKFTDGKASFTDADLAGVAVEARLSPSSPMTPPTSTTPFRSEDNLHTPPPELRMAQDGEARI